MKTFNFKRRNLSTGPHVFGLIGLGAGLFVIASPLFLSSGSSVEKTIIVGAIVSLIGLIILTSYSGTLIDLDGKRIKEYVVFCGYQTGKWESLPAIQKIKLVSASYKSTNTPNGVSPTLSGKVTEYKVLLYAGEATPAYSFHYAKEAAAQENAHLLSTKLGADLA